MKTIVVYQSKYGYTKQYAQWLAAELSCNLTESKDVSIQDLLQYDTIIYGGGLYAGGIAGISLITKSFEQLKDKHVIVWATGTSPGWKEDMEGIWNKAFDEAQRAKIQTYYLRGGFDYQKLTVWDKILMNMLKFMIKRKKNPTEDMKGMLKIYDAPLDFSKKEYTADLIAYVKGIKE